MQAGNSDLPSPSLMQGLYMVHESSPDCLYQINYCLIKNILFSDNLLVLCLNGVLAGIDDCNVSLAQFIN